jgi:Tfp pilus assembly protein PilF
MTEPLCDDSDAEQQCELNLEQALAVQPDNLDALQTMAQLRMLRKRDNEAKTMLRQIVGRTAEIIKKNAEEQSLGNIMNKPAANSSKSTETPSIEFRM